MLLRDKPQISQVVSMTVHDLSECFIFFDPEDSLGFSRVDKSGGFNSSARLLPWQEEGIDSVKRNREDLKKQRRRGSQREDFFRKSPLVTKLVLRASRLGALLLASVKCEMSIEIENMTHYLRKYR